LSLKKETFNAKKLKIEDYIGKGSMGENNSVYQMQNYVVGLSPARIYLQFAFKNALVPVVTVVGIVAGSLIGGAVLVEQVFVIPGLGAMLVGGVLQKDYPTVQSVALVLTIAVILINLIVDMACLVIDPRTRS